jgi:deoxyuridine 5'-triphosphate nucleotidohydrolase
VININNNKMGFINESNDADIMYYIAGFISNPALTSENLFREFEIIDDIHKCADIIDDCGTESHFKTFMRGYMHNIEPQTLLYTYKLDIDLSEKNRRFVTVPFDVVNNKTIRIRDINLIDFLGTVYPIEKLTFMFPEILRCGIRRVRDDAVLPSKPNLSDVGYDLTILERVQIFNKRTALYDTGLVISPPVGYYAEIVPRSSISKSGYMLANGTGIIDPSYRGHLMIALTKVVGDAPDIILPWKCCQLIFRPQYQVMFDTIVVDDDTKRGEGGFGSSSKTSEEDRQDHMDNTNASTPDTP